MKIKPSPCSLLMPVRNEASSTRPNLEILLDIYRHFPVFNEIVVLDDNSTDGTLSLLRKYDCRIFHTNGKMPTQSEKRNFLQQQAVNNWCLHLDADEWFDWSFLINLEKWIQPDSIERLPNAVAFKFPRLNQHHVYPDYQIRLMDKRYVVWRGAAHDRPFLKTTLRPVDEITKEGVKFCQTLDHHPIFHIPRDWEYDAEIQKHWRELEDAHRMDE